MGNDGGSIPDRRDLVRTKAKAEQADKANQSKARWFFCALSKKPLQEPIVSDALGKLYNKDAIIEYLLDKSAYGDWEEICGHIRSLKDVKTLKLTPNPAPSTTDDAERIAFVCPLNLKEMNGVQPFVYIATCGCVFSHAGLRTVAGSPKPAAEKAADAPLDDLDLCPQCAAKYSRADDVVPLNPPLAEQERLREALGARRAAAPPPKKKGKKRKQREDAAEGDAPAKKRQERGAPAPSIHPSVGAASRAVVEGLADEEAKRRSNMSAAVQSLYGNGQPKRKETFMTMGTFTRYA